MLTSEEYRKQSAGGVKHDAGGKDDPSETWAQLLAAIMGKEGGGVDPAALGQLLRDIKNGDSEKAYESLAWIMDKHSPLRFLPLGNGWVITNENPNLRLRKHEGSDAVKGVLWDYFSRHPELMEIMERDMGPGLPFASVILRGALPVRDCADRDDDIEYARLGHYMRRSDPLEELLVEYQFTDIKTNREAAVRHILQAAYCAENGSPPTEDGFFEEVVEAAKKLLLNVHDAVTYPPLFGVIRTVPDLRPGWYTSPTL